MAEFKIKIQKGDIMLSPDSAYEEEIKTLLNTALGEKTAFIAQHGTKDSSVAVQLPDIPGIKEIAKEIISQQKTKEAKVGKISVEKDIPVVIVDTYWFYRVFQKEITVEEAKEIIESIAKELAKKLNQE